MRGCASRATSRRCRPAARRSHGGFSLLEVVLALAILMGAVAVLGALMKSALHNARTARDLTQAQLFGESVMAAAAAGELPLESATQVPLATSSDARAATEWSYSIAVRPLNDTGLMEIQVTVEQAAEKPVRPFVVTRWINDPQALVPEESSTSSRSSSSSSGAGSSGGSNSSDSGS